MAEIARFQFPLVHVQIKESILIQVPFVNEQFLLKTFKSSSLFFILFTYNYVHFTYLTIFLFNPKNRRRSLLIAYTLILSSNNQEIDLYHKILTNLFILNYLSIKFACDIVTLYYSIVYTFWILYYAGIISWDA